VAVSRSDPAWLRRSIDVSKLARPSQRRLCLMNRLGRPLHFIQDRLSLIKQPVYVPTCHDFGPRYFDGAPAWNSNLLAAAAAIAIGDQLLSPTSSTAYCDVDEPGRCSAVSVEYKPGMFEDVKNEADFAEAISVPKAAIQLIEPTGETCSREGCNFPAINRNRGKCPLHEKRFYPKKGYERGWELQGIKYLCPIGPSKGRGCSCDMPQSCADSRPVQLRIWYNMSYQL